jgi:hypothetical protein
MAFHAKLKEASNQSDWALPIQFLERSSGQLVDLSGDDFYIAVVPTAPPPGSGYRSFNYGSGYGNAYAGRTAVLQGSTLTGELTVTGPGMLYVYFPVASMRSLPAGMYKVGLTCSNGAQTIQVAIGYLPVRDGIVMQPQAMATA